MARNLVNIDREKNKKLFLESYLLFRDLFSDKFPKCSNSTLCGIHIFDHWLSFEESRQLLPGWLDKTDSPELLNECKERRKTLTKFISALSENYEVYRYKWRGRRSYIRLNNGRMIYLLLNSGRPLPRNCLQFKSFLTASSKMSYLQYIEKDYSISLYIPELQLLIWSKDDYRFDFMFRSDMPNTFNILEKLAQDYGLHLFH